MDELSDELHEQITDLSEEGNELVEEGELDAAIRKFEEALALVPEPKTDWDAALWLYAAIGDTQFLAGRHALAADAMFSALNCPDAQANPFVHLRLGQSLIETGNTERGTEHLCRAFMLDGETVFENADAKYLAIVKRTLKPGRGE